MNMQWNHLIPVGGSRARPGQELELELELENNQLEETRQATIRTEVGARTEVEDAIQRPDLFFF